MSTPYLEFLENDNEDDKDEEGHNHGNPEGGEDPHPGPVDNAHEFKDDEGHTQQSREQTRDGNVDVLVLVHFN